MHLAAEVGDFDIFKILYDELRMDYASPSDFIKAQPLNIVSVALKAKQYEMLENIFSEFPELHELVGKPSWINEKEPILTPEYEGYMDYHLKLKKTFSFSEPSPRGEEEQISQEKPRIFKR